MRLYIAEKKETAMSISVALGGPSVPDGICFDIGDEKVTWLSGHLLRLRKPEEHDEAYQKWSLDYLPMEWPISYTPQDQHREHLTEIIDLARSAEELVNAGEPDPEGQRLVDEVIEYARLDKPVLRILINDNNPAAILRASLSMGSNNLYRGMSLSALARAVCDQHYGFNLTRAYTLLARKQGYVGMLSVGRVQTPILGLIVARDKAHDEYRPYQYQSVEATIEVQGKQLTARYIPKAGDLVDPSQRLIDASFADQLVAELSNAPVKIDAVTTQEHKVAPPLPHSLLSLQAEAAGKFGYAPRVVLEITQRLRDQYKAITYNRSDCRYLSAERYREASVLLDKLKTAFPEAEVCDSQRRSAAFDSDKVAAHHAIIPTVSVPDVGQLSGAELRIYKLISSAYMAQFYPEQRLRVTEINVRIGDHAFKTLGKVAVDQGWRAITDWDEASDRFEDIPENNLELITHFDRGKLLSIKTNTQQTLPPPRYTMKTLLLDLTRVANYVTDPEIKRLLLEKDATQHGESVGIGTPGTRHGHIETLFSREYIEERDGVVISTSIGREFHDALPAFAVKPDLTALWHQKQRLIESGLLDYQELIDEVDGIIADEIERVKAQGLDLHVNTLSCPVCAKGHLVLRQNKQKTPFWGCSEFPKCRATYSDVKGKPLLDDD
ncbi:DNA topoisomerase [Leucothrix pacifica]|uniref:DNA topoisomerase n=1 Tax=Leucothrix pacifica TaxID=1247513 RepID=A0A317CNG6_9GAMM|nr:DNA topoisomerase [Leucothrix pacifica]PWQ97860.1 DNA topoisomerase I [Leucothrix pacifica]